LLSIPPGCGFRCKPVAQPSFEKVTAQVKVVPLRPVRSTIPPLRVRKPMPPSGPWPLSANRSGWRYRVGKSPSMQQGVPVSSNQAETIQRVGFHPDNTTPIPRPSRYYGRRQYAPVTHQLRKNSADQKQTSLGPPLVPNGLDSNPGRIDKSQLALAEPKRLRDKAHLKFVTSQPCLMCGR
jgi:hypothetical protein